MYLRTSIKYGGIVEDNTHVPRTNPNFCQSINNVEILRIIRQVIGKPRLRVSKIVRMFKIKKQGEYKPCERTERSYSFVNVPIL